MLYFFNVAGAVYDPAVSGLELSSISAARAMAARFAGELILDKPELVWAGEELRVEVTNASHLLLFTVVISGVEASAVGTFATKAAS